MWDYAKSEGSNQRRTTQPNPWAAHLVMKGCLLGSKVARSLLEHLPSLEECCACVLCLVKTALPVGHAAVLGRILLQPHLGSFSATDSGAIVCFINTDLSAQVAIFA